MKSNHFLKQVFEDTVHEGLKYYEYEMFFYNRQVEETLSHGS